MSLSKFTNEELEAELERRRKNPTWWIREAVTEGIIPDSNEPGYDEFCEATAWMDEADKPRHEE